MTKRMCLSLALAAGLACAQAGVARAEDQSPTPRPGVSLGGRASYFWNNGQNTDSGNWMGGAQLRVYLAKLFAVEGSADYRQARFANAFADIYPVQVSGLLYLLPSSPVSPYLLGGVGWYYTRVRGPSGFSRTTNSFGSHVGGGMQFFIHRHWSLDASYRYIFTDRITTSGGNVNATVSGSGHMATGGINFHF
jgi:opacity protein-like surface antigen